MKSRSATLVTLVALVGGSGGAIAIGASGSSGGPGGGAAVAQYCNTKDHQCPPPRRGCGRHHRQLCPTKPKRCYYWTANRRHSYECSAGEKANFGFRRPSSKKGVRGVSTTRRAPGSSFTG